MFPASFTPLTVRYIHVAVPSVSSTVLLSNIPSDEFTIIRYPFFCLSFGYSQFCAIVNEAAVYNLVYVAL